MLLLALTLAAAARAAPAKASPKWEACAAEKSAADRRDCAAYLDLLAPAFAKDGPGPDDAVKGWRDGKEDYRSWKAADKKGGPKISDGADADAEQIYLKGLVEYQQGNARQAWLLWRLCLDAADPKGDVASDCRQSLLKLAADGAKK